MNPYQSPTMDRDSLPKTQGSLAGALILLVWIIAIVVSTHLFGAHGFGISLYIVACSWIIITRINAKLLWPLNRAKPTGIEWLVVFAICGVLYGLALPTVMTNCEGRRKPNLPLSINASASPSGDDNTLATSADIP